MIGTILSVGQAAKGFLSGEARARRQERRAQRQDRREQRQAARQEVVQRIQQPLTGRASLPAPAVGNNAAGAGPTLAARTPFNFQRMLLPLLGIGALFLLFQGGKRVVRRRTARRAAVRRAPVRRKRRR